MANNHDKVAEQIAKRLHGTYDPTKSPDVRGYRGRAEIKSSASEIPKALCQLSGSGGPVYVVLPKREHKQALERLLGLKTGLMDCRGNVIKRSRRK